MFTLKLVMLFQIILLFFIMWYNVPNLLLLPLCFCYLEIGTIFFSLRGRLINAHSTIFCSPDPPEFYGPTLLSTFKCFQPLLKIQRFYAKPVFDIGEEFYFFVINIFFPLFLLLLFVSIHSYLSYISIYFFSILFLFGSLKIFPPSQSES